MHRRLSRRVRPALVAPVLGLLVAVLVPVATSTAPAAVASSGRPPVYHRDFPDPDVILVDGTYYAYGTNTFSAFATWLNLPILRSTDLATWELAADGLPELGRWADEGATWSPGVQRYGNRWVVYYTARHRASGAQCIGRAVADHPEGPFVDSFPGPLKCQLGYGGAIDADTFTSGNGRRYLTWKNDGNCCGIYVSLWVQELSADGLHLVGPTRRLLGHDRPWERPLIEQPDLLWQNGRHWLLYSGNWWESPSYASGYATCGGPMGRCTKRTLHGPWHTNTPYTQGPGAIDVFFDELGRPWMAHHGWRTATSYRDGGYRTLFVDRIDFSTGRPRTRSTVPYTSAAAPPIPVDAIPVVGSWSRSGPDGIIWYAPGPAPDQRWFGDVDETFSARPPVTVNSPYVPVPGDFNGDRRDDVLWYGPGGARDYLWLGARNGHFVGRSVTIRGTYQPAVGDFDGDGRDDILWSNGSSSPDPMWFGRADGGFAGKSVAGEVGTAAPVAGDFNGDGRHDVLWFGPGAEADTLWWGVPGRAFVATAVEAGTTAQPVAGDFDGDRRHDVLWYGAGPAPDVIWRGGGTGGSFTEVPVTVETEAAPVVGDFDRDGADDVVWYGAGAAPDEAWFGGPGPAFHVGPAVTIE